MGFHRMDLRGHLCDFPMFRYLISSVYTRFFFAILIACGLDMTHFSFKMPFVCCTMINMNELNFPITKTLTIKIKIMVPKPMIRLQSTLACC